MSIKSSSSFSRMRRYPDQGWIAGVCAGLAEYFSWNIKLVRVIFALAFFFSGFFPVGVAYAVLWYVLDVGQSGGTRHSDRHDPPPFRPPGNPSAHGSADVKTRFMRLEERLRGLEECVSSKEFELRRELRKLET